MSQTLAPIKRPNLFFAAAVEALREWDGMAIRGMEWVDACGSAISGMVYHIQLINADPLACPLGTLGTLGTSPDPLLTTSRPRPRPPPRPGPCLLVLTGGQSHCRYDCVLSLPVILSAPLHVAPYAPPATGTGAGAGAVPGPVSEPVRDEPARSRLRSIHTKSFHKYIHPDRTRPGHTSPVQPASEHSSIRSSHHDNSDGDGPEGVAQRPHRSGRSPLRQ